MLNARWDHLEDFGNCWFLDSTSKASNLLAWTEISDWDFFFNLLREFCLREEFENHSSSFSNLICSSHWENPIKICILIEEVKGKTWEPAVHPVGIHTISLPVTHWITRVRTSLPNRLKSLTFCDRNSIYSLESVEVYDVTQAAFELMILLSQPLQGWDCRHVLSCLISPYISQWYFRGDMLVE